MTNIFINLKLKYTILSLTKAHRFGGFEIFQRGSVYMLVNMNGYNVIFNRVYKQKMNTSYVAIMILREKKIMIELKRK